MLETYVIHVTKECNMDCLYCYEKDKTSKYTWKEVKELIENILRYRTSNIFNIEFLGGEPLLTFDLIKKSYEYLESIEEANVNSYIITTNGTILNDEIITFLKRDNRIHFAASLDGYTHANQLRVFKDGRKNSYDKVMENLKTLIKNSVRPSIHMVTHPYNVAFISDSIEHFYKQGIRSIGVGTVESRITIDDRYCNRFIEEMDIVSDKIVEGKYPDLHIDLLSYLKPKSDNRTYIKDEKGKTIGESYGRSGKDVTNTSVYNSYVGSSSLGDLIYNLREKVYLNHQNKINKKM